MECHSNPHRGVCSVYKPGRREYIIDKNQDIKDFGAGNFLTLLDFLGSIDDLVNSLDGLVEIHQLNQLSILRMVRWQRAHHSGCVT